VGRSRQAVAALKRAYRPDGCKSEGEPRDPCMVRRSRPVTRGATCTCMPVPRWLATQTFHDRHGRRSGSCPSRSTQLDEVAVGMAKAAVNRRFGGRLASEPGRRGPAPRSRPTPTVGGRVNGEEISWWWKLSGWAIGVGRERGIKVPLSCIRCRRPRSGCLQPRADEGTHDHQKQRSGVIQARRYHSMDGWSFLGLRAWRNAVDDRPKGLPLLDGRGRSGEPPVATVGPARGGRAAVLGATTSRPTHAAGVGPRDQEGLHARAAELAERAEAATGRARGRTIAR